MNGLKFIRTRCNISLNELADILDVSRQQVSAWENGVKPISQKKIKPVIEVFLVLTKNIFWIYQKMIKSLLFPKLYIAVRTMKKRYIVL